MHPYRQFELLLKKYNIEAGGDCVQAGWWPLVENLIQDLIALGWDRDLHQVKEKFGGLRFYVGETTEEISKRIAKAEADSFKICEYCGKPGKRRTGVWILTLCDECAGKKCH